MPYDPNFKSWEGPPNRISYAEYDAMPPEIQMVFQIDLESWHDEDGNETHWEEWVYEQQYTVELHKSLLGEDYEEELQDYIEMCEWFKEWQKET